MSGAARNIQRLDMRKKFKLNPVDTPDGSVRFFDTDPEYSIVMTDDATDYPQLNLSHADGEQIWATYSMMLAMGASFDAKQDYLWTVMDKYTRRERAKA